MLVSHKTIGRNIRKARDAAGLTQEQIAEKLGISQLHFGRLERGERPASLEQLANIARVLRVSTAALLRGCIIEETLLVNADQDAQTLSSAIGHIAQGVSPKARSLMLDVCRVIAEHDRTAETDA